MKPTRAERRNAARAERALVGWRMAGYEGGTVKRAPIRHTPGSGYISRLVKKLAGANA